jgi:hypothetical protein
LLPILWIIIDIYLFSEGHTIPGFIFFACIFISYVINVSWSLGYYRPFIKNKDAFYFKYAKNYPKTELFVRAMSYLFCYQLFRIGLSRFLSLEMFSGSLHRDRIISRVMNMFTVVFIALVCLPIIGLNIFAIFFLDLSDSALYHHIECWILMSFLVVALIVEISMGNKLNTYDSFMLKSAYEQTCEELAQVSKKGALQSKLIRSNLCFKIFS